MNSESRSNGGGDSSSYSDHDARRPDAFRPDAFRPDADADVDPEGDGEADSSHSGSDHLNATATAAATVTANGVKFEPLAAPKGKRTARTDSHDTANNTEDAPPSKKKALALVVHNKNHNASSTTAIHQDNEDPSKGAGGSGSVFNKTQKPKKSEKAAPGEYRKPPGWTPDDEMTLAKVLIGCSSGGQVQMLPFYERAHEALPETSNSQVYDKMRRMRTRFWQIRRSLMETGMLEERFPFRSHHEAHLYKIWKQIWGDENERNPNPKGGVSGDRLCAGGGGSGDSEEETDRYFNRAVSNHLKDSLQSAMEEGLSKIEAAVERVASQTPPPGLGLCVEGLLSSLYSKFQDIKESASSGTSSFLSGSESRSLRQKSRRIKMDELRLFAAQLDLLQDECRFCLKRYDGQMQ